MVAAVQAREPGGDGSLSRPVYDAPHAPRPWGGKVSAYLWTKSIAAGALLVGALGGWEPLFNVVAPIISLLFLAITAALLVFDLKRPDRFAYILMKPNWRSWLVWGAWILMAFGVTGVVWLFAGFTHHRTLMPLVVPPAVLLALATAGYSAFLFGQAEGRDFWQSPLVLPHLIVAAFVAGTGALILATAAFGSLDPRVLDGLRPLLLLSVAAHGLLLALELFSRHPVRDVALAARLITRGGYRGRFRAGVEGAGVVLPLALVIVGASMDSIVATALAALLALAGLWVWEDVWVKAGQSVPLS
jgi:formate-dependent nitrite reductase membrane component NrfD